MSSFPERLAELMFDKNISTKELALILDVNTTTVSDWRRGKYSVILSNAIKLADLFECSLDFLMGRVETVIDYSPKECPPFYQHFISVLKECGITTYRMREDSPIKGSYFDKWKKGTDPLVTTLIMAADHLKISLDILVGRDPSPLKPKQNSKQ